MQQQKLAKCYQWLIIAIGSVISLFCICRLTFDSASTLPSAVSNVSEMFCASTTRRLGAGCADAIASSAAGRS